MQRRNILMSYSAKIHKKCTFPKMGNKPLPNKKVKKVKKVDNSTTLKEWRDGWFKGQYESKQ